MQSALGEVRMAMLSDRGSTPLISTNAYYGNGLASHTVKNLVNMRVLGFLNQFGRFTPFLFSCLFCALFAHFLQNQQGQFCALFKILESRAPSGFAASLGAAPTALGAKFCAVCGPPGVRPLRTRNGTAVPLCTLHHFPIKKRAVKK